MRPIWIQENPLDIMRTAFSKTSFSPSTSFQKLIKKMKAFALLQYEKVHRQSDGESGQANENA